MSKRKYRKKFRATFENGGFFEYYKDLERQFENFLEYVPYLDVNETVISFKLANLLLSIGGFIDSAFKEMVFYKKFTGNAKFMEIRRQVKEGRRRIKAGQSPIQIKIDTFLDVFEPEYNLSTQEVECKRLPERENIIPFYPQSTSRIVPKWWDLHNQVKHDFKHNFEKGNLQITRDALAGAFLLNAVHYPSLYRLYEFDVIKKEERVVRIGFESKPYPVDYIKRRYEKGKEIPYKLETPLFIFNYEAKQNSDLISSL